MTYDDTYSLGDKATFAKQNGMAGCFTWSLDQVGSLIRVLLFATLFALSKVPLPNLFQTL